MSDCSKCREEYRNDERRLDEIRERQTELVPGNEPSEIKQSRDCSDGHRYTDCFTPIK